MDKIRRLFPSRAQWRENRVSFLLCLASGLFGGIIFHQNWMGIFAWVALVPYIVALGRFRDAKSIVWGTYIFGVTWYYLSLWWLHTLTIFSLWIPIAVPALAVVEATYFLAFAFPANFAMKRLPAWLVPWVLAAMWPGMEYLRTWTDFAFPWNYLGHSQAPRWSATLPWVSLGGVYIVSGFIALAATGVVQIGISVSGRRAVRSQAHVWGFVSGFIAFIALLGGIAASKVIDAAGRIQPLSSGPATEEPNLSIAVIQPGIAQTKKWDAIMGVPGEDEKQQQQRFNDTDREMQDAALRLVDKASASEEKPQLYVLPETSFLSPWFVYQTQLHRDLQRLAVNLNADVFFGADNRVPMDVYLTGAHGESTTPTLPQMPLKLDDHGVTVPAWEKEPQMANFNSAWLVTPERGLSANAYNKIQLVPFGETVPIIGHFEWFQKLAMAGSFYSGLDAPIFQSHGVKFGSVICFESAFPSLTSALARKGAEMIVVLTNDAWYDPKYLMEKGGFWGTLFKLPILRELAAAGPKQHFAHSIFRAIETRLPLVRAANTGISAIIEPTGDVQKQLEYSTSGEFTANVAVPPHELTFYARYGDWFAWCGLCVLVGMLAWEVRDIRRAKTG